jgi:hypothetical protein
MLKKISDQIFTALRMVTGNYFIMLIWVAILFLPAVATAGQYYSTDYFKHASPILLLYWPGSSIELKVSLTTWIFMSIIFLSYMTGIFLLLKRRTLGKVVLITVAIFIIAGILKAFLGTAFGWKEAPMPDLSGRVNQAILSLWHNPAWEEVVFRGIPLLLLLASEKFFSGRRTRTGVIIYIIIPSVFCGLYHIYGHGIIRFFDTVLIASGFAWMALRYTFLAPLTMHYVADSMMVSSINKIPSVRPEEVKWITEYGNTINSVSTLLTLIVMIILAGMTIYYYRKIHRGLI